MDKWDIKIKPTFDFCPEQYCFCWVPPKGEANLSGKEYNSFEEATKPNKDSVVFLHGGCSAPFGPCVRTTKNKNHEDCYEPYESLLKKDSIPPLFFCNPVSLSEEFMPEYNETVSILWK